MKKFNKFSAVLVAVLALCLVGPIAAFAATTPSLGSATTYGVLGSTYTNTTAGTTINGDVGFTTGPAVAPLGTYTNYGSGAPYATAGIDQGSALSALDALTCDFTYGSVTDISLLTQPLTPGVYCVAGAMSIGTGGITLNGAGTYVFRSAGALTTVANSAVTLAGGASACDVFWTPTAATTFGANTTFAGTVISNAGITVGANTMWTGRSLAFGGTVTTATDTITVPTCTVTPLIPTPTTTITATTTTTDTITTTPPATITTTISPTNQQLIDQIKAQLIPLIQQLLQILQAQLAAMLALPNTGFSAN